MGFTQESNHSHENEVKTLQEDLKVAKEKGEHEKAAEIRKELNSLKKTEKNEDAPIRNSKEEELQKELQSAWEQGDKETARELKQELKELDASLPSRPTQEANSNTRDKDERVSKREELEIEEKNATSEEERKEIQKQKAELNGSSENKDQDPAPLNGQPPKKTKGKENGKVESSTELPNGKDRKEGKGTPKSGSEKSKESEGPNQKK